MLELFDFNGNVSCCASCVHAKSVYFVDIFGGDKLRTKWSRN